jgi:diguanylate cyclase (GGDEF)-like protein
MNEVLMLDVRTLAFASSLGGFLMALTMMGIYLAGMQTRALIDWSLAGLAFGSGYLLGHLLQTVTVPVPIWFAVSLANALIAMGHGFILIGVQRYLGRTCWTVPIVLLVIAIFLSTWLFAPLGESLRWRIVTHSGTYVLISGYAGWLLLSAKRPGMRLFHRAVASVLLLFVSFLAVRLAYALFSPGLTGSFVQDPFQAFAFLAAMIFGFFLTMALAVMMFREKQLELRDQARTDPLTGMRNRQSMDQIAEREIMLADRTGQSLSMILFDIDHFKRINDDHGHQVGDQVLRSVAACIGRAIRSGDTAFRFGGEEFLVLLPGADADQAAQVAERMRKSIAESPVDLGDRVIRLTASFGVVQWRTGREDWDGLIKRADQALYQAKHGGRDRVVSPSIHVAAVLT